MKKKRDQPFFILLIVAWRKHFVNTSFYDSPTELFSFRTYTFIILQKPEKVNIFE
jgi:hypothetical protein